MFFDMKTSADNSILSLLRLLWRAVIVRYLVVQVRSSGAVHVCADDACLCVRDHVTTYYNTRPLFTTQRPPVIPTLYARFTIMSSSPDIHLLRSTSADLALLRIFPTKIHNLTSKFTLLWLLQLLGDPPGFCWEIML